MNLADSELAPWIQMAMPNTTIRSTTEVTGAVMIRCQMLVLFMPKGGNAGMLLFSCQKLFGCQPSLRLQHPKNKDVL